MNESIYYKNAEYTDARYRPSNLDKSDLDFVGEPIKLPFRIVFAVMGILMILIGLMGNVLFLTVLLRFSLKRKKGQAHNFFLVNLAMADLCSLLTWLLMFVLDMILGYHPVVNRIHCAASAIMGISCYIVSVISLVSIALNRYVNVVFYKHYARFFSLKLISLTCVFIWVTAFLITLPGLLYPWGEVYVYHKVLHICFSQSSVVANEALVTIFTFLPAMVVITFNMLTFRFWKKHRMKELGQVSMLKGPAPALIVSNLTDESAMDLKHSSPYCPPPPPPPSSFGDTALTVTRLMPTRRSSFTNVPGKVSTKEFAVPKPRRRHVSSVEPPTFAVHVVGPTPTDHGKGNPVLGQRGHGRLDTDSPKSDGGGVGGSSLTSAAVLDTESGSLLTLTDPSSSAAAPAAAAAAPRPPVTRSPAPPRPPPTGKSDRGGKLPVVEPWEEWSPGRKATQSDVVRAAVLPSVATFGTEDRTSCPPKVQVAFACDDEPKSPLRKGYSMCLRFTGIRAIFPRKNSVSVGSVASFERGSSSRRYDDNVSLVTVPSVRSENRLSTGIPNGNRSGLEPNKGPGCSGPSLMGISGDDYCFPESTDGMRMSSTRSAITDDVSWTPMTSMWSKAGNGKSASSVTSYRHMTPRSTPKRQLKNVLPIRRQMAIAKNAALVRSLFVVSLVMAFSQIPFFIVSTLRSFVHPLPPVELSAATFLFIFISSAVNWVVYGIMNPSFRRDYSRFMAHFLIKVCHMNLDRIRKWFSIQSDTFK